MSERAPELGRIVPPYPVDRCANFDCPHRGGDGFEDAGAYFYRDLERDKFVVFCGDCARHAELNAPLRFKLVPL